MYKIIYYTGVLLSTRLLAGRRRGEGLGGPEGKGRGFGGPEEGNGGRVLLSYIIHGKTCFFKCEFRCFGLNATVLQHTLVGRIFQAGMVAHNAFVEALFL